MTAKTYTLREAEIERRWYVVDATDETLGRLATRIAHVIVLNAAKVAVSRDKLESKIYARHSGYPQGYKEETLGHLMERRPEEAVRRAVKGMVPHTRLGAQQLRKLKIYAGPDHPHQAQRPEPLA
jgi:large subunit ribosomal protein L13